MLNRALPPEERPIFSSDRLCSKGRQPIRLPYFALIDSDTAGPNVGKLVIKPPGSLPGRKPIRLSPRDVRCRNQAANSSLLSQSKSRTGVRLPSGNLQIDE